MFGYQRFAKQSADVVSAATFGPAVQIDGATAIFLNVGTFATAADWSVCVGNTATTAQLLPLYYNSYSGGVVPVSLSTAASQYMCDVSMAKGWKYMKVQASIAMVDGATMNVYTAQ